MEGFEEFDAGTGQPVQYRTPFAYKLKISMRLDVIEPALIAEQFLSCGIVVIFIFPLHDLRTQHLICYI